MKILIGFVMALILSASATAYAQDKAATPAAPPTARQIELARQLVEVSGMRSRLSSIFTSVISMIESSMSRGDTPEERKISDAVQAAAQDQFGKIVPKMIDISANIYAQNYTEQELSDVLTFYKSPSGQSMLAKTPVITQAVSAAVKPMIPQMQRDMVADMCDRIACTPAMRAAILEKLPKGPAS